MNIKEQLCPRILPTHDSPCSHIIKDEFGSMSMCSLNEEFRCTEAIKANSVWLSYSAVQNYLRCKRLYWYKNIKGLVLLPQYESYALKMGMLWDKLQELIYGVTGVTEETIRNYINEIQIDDLYRAKVSAVYRAHQDLIVIDKTDFIGLQQHFIWHNWNESTNDVIVHGYYDRLYKDYFAENKFTSDKRYYNNTWVLNSQIGTYFLANEKLEKVIMEIVQTPKQKLFEIGKKRAENEQIENYEERIYSEIIANPYNTFIGYDAGNKTYGMEFYRDEFNLKELEYRYKWIVIEIMDCAKRNSFYMNDRNCFMYNTMCEYSDICTTGGYVNEERYKIRDKQQNQ